MMTVRKAQPAAKAGNRDAEENGDSKMTNELAIRLANIEALLMELLDRRKQTVRTGARRSHAVQQRLRAEVLAKGQPSPRHFEMARKFLAQQR
jgi:hypothetical protein